MKATGIVRNLDDLGRVVLPIELRRTLGLAEKDAVEVFVDGERIILQKYEPGCNFCGGIQEVSYFRGKLICINCVTDIKQKVV